MAILNFFKKVFSEKKVKLEASEELGLFLWKCENHFFDDNGNATLEDKHKMTFLVALRLFYPGKDFNPICKRHQVFAFFDVLYKYSNAEMQAHCDQNPIDSLFDILATLPLKTKIAMVLIFNCILYIDKNQTDNQKDIAKSIIAIMGIEYSFYKKLINDFKGGNTWHSLDHIFIDCYLS